jgi:hypothetical protein
MTAMYRKEYKKPWTFTKPGVVILKEKDIVVLEEGRQLKNSMPQIITDEASSKKYGVVPKVAFDQWFDIIDPLQNKVISKFKLDTTPLGDSLLINNALQSEFPAVVQDPVIQRTYYFSGDFATYNVPFVQPGLKVLRNSKEFSFPINLTIPEDSSGFITGRL